MAEQGLISRPKVIAVAVLLLLAILLNFDRLFALFSSSGPSVAQRATGLRRLAARGKLAEAWADCLDLLDDEPDDPWVLRLAADLARQRNDFERAEEFLTAGLEAHEDDSRWRSEFCFELGRTLDDLGQSEAAAKKFSACLGNEASYFHLAALENRLGRHEEAVGHAQAGIDEHPYSARLHRCLGDALAGLGRWEDAAEAFRQALMVSGSDVESLVGLADMHLQTGDPSSAKRLLGKVIRRSPRHERARRLLAKCSSS